jgi:hypothetical protein
MGHPEELSEDFDENRELARKMGWQDLVDGFDLVYSEVGRIQTLRAIGKKRNKKKRNLRERHFQNYIINKPQVLTQLEPGLRFVREEKPIRSGRPDIDAIDKDQNKARIELKANDYDSVSTHVKLRKYLLEDDTEKARVFFIAPSVKPDLFFSLRDFQKAGRIRFFEYEKLNGDYSFKEVQADYFKEPVDIDWSRRKRQTADNGLIKVTSAAAGQAKIKRKPKKKVEIEKPVELIEPVTKQPQRLIGQSAVKQIEELTGQPTRNVLQELEATGEPVHVKRVIKGIPTEIIISKEDGPNKVRVDVFPRPPCALRDEILSGQTEVVAEKTQLVAPEYILEKSAFVGGEAIKAGTFHKDFDSYPFYYQAFLAANQGAKNTERFLKLDPVTHEDKYGLERLMLPHQLKITEGIYDLAYKQYPKQIRGFGFETLVDEEGNSIIDTIVGSTPSALDLMVSENASQEGLFKKQIEEERTNIALQKGIETGAQYTRKMHRIIKKAIGSLSNPGELTAAELASLLHTEQKKLERILDQAIVKDKTMRKFRRVLRESSAALMNHSISTDHVEPMTFLAKFPYESLINNFLATKIKRAERLDSINQELGNLYLGYNPKLMRDVIHFLRTGELNEEIIRHQDGTAEVVLSQKRIREFINQDNACYRSILGNMPTIGEPEDWGKYPLYYQVMLLHDIAYENRGKYLQPIEIEEEQMSQLEGLRTSSDLEDKLSKYREEGDFDEQHPRDIDMKKIHTDTIGQVFKGSESEFIRHKNAMEKSFLFFEHLLELFNEYNDSLFRFLGGELQTTNVIDIESLKEYHSSLARRLSAVDRGQLSRYKKIRMMIREQSEVMGREAKRLGDPFIAEFADKYYNLRRARTLESFLKLKYERVKALDQVDHNLAIAYLRYSVTTDEAIANSSEKLIVDPLSHVPIKEYIRKDSQVYTGILENLVAEEAEEVIEIEEPEPVQAPKSEKKPKKPAYLRPDSAKKAIINRHARNLNPESKARINNFIGDALDSQYSPGQLKDFWEVFRKFDLDRRVRNRVEVPTSIQMQNFFDDVTGAYVRKGKIPTTEDLNNLYRQDCSISKEDRAKRTAFSILNNRLDKAENGRKAGTYDPEKGLLTIDPTIANGNVGDLFIYKLTGIQEHKESIKHYVQKGILKQGKIDKALYDKKHIKPVKI